MYRFKFDYLGMACECLVTDASSLDEAYDKVRAAFPDAYHFRAV